MAKLVATGFDDLYGKFKTVSGGSAVDSVMKMGLYDGADVLADEIRKRCPVDDGDLVNSLFISRFYTTDGGWETTIGFAGYDHDGVPNQLKANVLESGSSRTPKHPFIRPAFNAVKAEANKRIAERCQEEISKIMEE